MSSPPNNGGHQASFKDIQDIDDEEWELTFSVNIHAMFYLTKAAVRHMKEGGVIIKTASMNADFPSGAPGQGVVGRYKGLASFGRGGMPLAAPAL